MAAPRSGQRDEARWLLLITASAFAFALLTTVAVVTAGSSTEMTAALPAPTPSEPPPAGSPCPAGVDGRKAPLRGIVTIGSLPDGPDRAYVGGLSVNVPWADLQPEPDAPLVRPNAVDVAVAQARDARIPGGCPRGVKVRVLAGVHAPSWAKVLGGPPVDVVLVQEDGAGTVPRFWTAEFGRAYDELQERLAKIYDAVPEVREVVISRCMTFYAEPMLRQVGGGRESALSAAGLDEAADRDCLRAQVDAHAVWQRTPSSLALNPYVKLTDKVGEGSLAVPLETADHCRASLGERCILANNSIRWPPLGRKYLELYESMAALGPPLEFQTAAPRRIGDATATLRWAVDRDVGSVEMEPRLITTAGTEFDSVARSASWGSDD